MKMSAKLNLSTHMRDQIKTGSGEKPPSPSPEDLEVMVIAPHDFVIEVNDNNDVMVNKISYICLFLYIFNLK